MNPCFKSFLFVLLASFLLTACSHTYYVVRHAEKANAAAGGGGMSSPNNPPLSAPGEQRAQALMETLKDSKIDHIFSTNTIRTRTTAEPLRKAKSLTIEEYGPMPDSAFIQKLKGLKKNVLVVGHSNTVDDIVNGLTGQKTIPGDLLDSEYSNLFVVTYKGKKVKFERRTYGAQ
jgi:broad specificity phosphatase PhoE